VGIAPQQLWNSCPGCGMYWHIKFKEGGTSTLDKSLQHSWSRALHPLSCHRNEAKNENENGDFFYVPDLDKFKKIVMAHPWKFDKGQKLMANVLLNIETK
jgi:hypothetical protein